MGEQSPAPDVPVPVLKLDGEEFRCVAHLPQWHMMKLSAGLMASDVEALAAMHNFLHALVDPEDWPAFDRFMGDDDNDITRDKLDHAIGDVLAEMGGRGKASTGSSGRSSGGSPTPATPPISRVVSLSRGTVEVSEPSLSVAATSSTG